MVTRARERNCTPGGVGPPPLSSGRLPPGNTVRLPPGNRVRLPRFSAAVLAMLVFLAGCGPRFSVTRIEDDTCAEKRLKAAKVSLEESKNQFAEHFRLRSDLSLRYAYLGSVDSERLARSIRRCFDYQPDLKPRAIDLIRANRRLRRLIARNLRDLDPQLAIGVFDEQYREIFKNDIN